MNITVFGASSATGQLLVERALASGHDVTAFVRNAASITAVDPHLTVVTGDALDLRSVSDAVAGADAVLSTIGPKGKPRAITAAATQNIVDAMKEHGTRRLVLISVAGIFEPEDRPSGSNKVISGLIKMLQREVFEDREKQLDVLEASGLEWVATRVPRLTDKPATGQVYVGYWQNDTGLSLTRHDLADVMLAQLTSDEWLRTAPVVANQS